MSKKCEHCKKLIDVHQGRYVNVYTKPFELHTYHLVCYDEYVGRKLLLGSLPKAFSGIHRTMKEAENDAANPL